MDAMSRCQLEPTSAAQCPFSGIIETPLYESAGRIHCVFHALMDSRLVGDSSKSKSDFSVEEFSNLFATFVERVIKNNDKYEPSYKPTESARATRIVRYLQDRLGTRVGLMNFRKVVFPDKFRFLDSTLIDADFQGAEFAGECSFSNTSFVFRANFSSVNFRGDTSFDGCKFGAWALFDGCRFGSRVGFTNTIFKDELRFDGSKIGQIHLCCSDLAKSTDEEKKTIIPLLSLSKCEIDDMLCMRHRTVDRIDLSQTVFNVAPVLVSAKVGGDTVFRDANFRDHSPNHGNRYAVLGRMARESGDFLGAETLRALEFDCYSKSTSSDRFSRFLIRAYSFCSRYGTRSDRPLILLGVAAVLYTALYALYAAYFDAGWDGLTAAVGFSARQMIKPLGVLDASAVHGISPFRAPSALVSAVAVSQSFITLLLFGLFLQSIYRVFNK